MPGCLACDLASGEAELPGGLIAESSSWRVEHCVGPLGLGTLVVKPKRHVTAIADLSGDEAGEMGPLLWRTASVVGALTSASQVYVCLWSHGPVHVHFVVQPELGDALSEFEAHGPNLQAAMFTRGGGVDPAQAAEFADRARAWLVSTDT
jgi:diadenosine tetraphosphate (Ap4A) HIT family hydrolase